MSGRCVGRWDVCGVLARGQYLGERDHRQPRYGSGVVHGGVHPEGDAAEVTYYCGYWNRSLAKEIVVQSGDVIR